MGKPTKQTKKFQKNHLKATIKKRKEDQSKKKQYDKREAIKTRREKEQTEKRKIRSEKREEEKRKLNDLESFSDEEVDPALYKDVNDFLDNFDKNDNGEDSDDDVLSEISDQPPSDDEEEESTKEDPNQDLKQKVTEHKKELDNLQKLDPEFYDFLQKNSADLLDFGEDDEFAGLDDEQDDENDENDDQMQEDSDDDIPKASKASKKHKGQITLSVELIDELINNVQDSQSTKAMKKLVIAYKAGCHFHEGEEVTEEGARNPYRVNSSEVYNHLMITGIQLFPKLFHSLLGIEQAHEEEETEYQQSKNKNKKKFVRLQTRITKHERWRKLQTCVKAYLKNTIFLLDQLTDPKISCYMLKQCGKSLLVYFACLPQLANKLLKVLNRFWSAADETSRVLAFIAIRELAILTPYPFIDTVLKLSYLTFVKNAKFTNKTTLGLVQFMSNCVIELFGLDYKASYQHAFSHIRVLAVKLRNAITTKSKENIALIYSWQFYHSLNVWAEMLCTYSTQQDLQLLVYPLVQVISGAIQLSNAQKYYPYLFLCIRSLHRLAGATNLFIPTLPFLLRVLEGPEFRKRFKPSSEKPLDWTCNVKAPNNLLHTRVFFDGVVEQVFDLILEHFSIYAYSISFPELTVPTILALKRFTKQTKAPEYSKIFKQLVQQLENAATFIRSHRLKIDFAPKDVEKADSFLQQYKESDKSPLTKFFLQHQKSRKAQLKSDSAQAMLD